MPLCILAKAAMCLFPRHWAAVQSWRLGDGFYIIVVDSNTESWRHPHRCGR